MNEKNIEAHLANKIWVIVGTRPEVIKQAPVFRKLVEIFDSKKQAVVLVGTGQHTHLLDQALESFQLKLDYNLQFSRSQEDGLPQMAASILTKFAQLITIARPKAVVVQGDTTSAFVVAMACFYAKIPVYHNEAGYRSYDLAHPFPEEANRKWISCIANKHFAPTTKAKKALLAEGVEENKIFIVGNSGIDSLVQTLKNSFSSPLIEKIKLKKQDGYKVALLTSHRRENSGLPMDSWYKNLADYFAQQKCLIICPIHPNHLAKPSVEKYLTEKANFLITEALEYQETCNILSLSDFVITDSGGIQEEACYLGLPCIVCRKTTERSEIIDNGLGRLVDPVDLKLLQEAFKWALDFNRKDFQGHRWEYGEGHAAEKIAKIIRNDFVDGR